ncbi:hypothetical protein NCCP2165_29280 [Halomonas sp. NCCP-2165]|nr:hypothetical protein NCCP2165_29280 [Halomonas sp. NCCP-2165]
MDRGRAFVWVCKPVTPVDTFHEESPLAPAERPEPARVPAYLTARHTKNPDHLMMIGASLKKCLTMTYSRMGRPHTTIGAERFHC